MDDHNRRMKRGTDVLLTIAALPLVVPIALVVALAVRVGHGSPVLFRHERLGHRGEPFEVLKFRTMTDARDEHGALLPDEQRLTRLGRWLRATSLDELPELWNVLRGEMSLVGPRPLPTAYLARYTAQEARRHEVRPGLTGWAQVNGRNALGWDDRLALDVWYVEHRTLRLDLRILWRTVAVVARRDGISGGGTDTMTELRPDHGARSARLDP